MKIPVIKCSKIKFYLQFLYLFNNFKFRLSDNGMKLLSRILCMYDDYRQNHLGVGHDVVSNKVMDEISLKLIQEELGWKKNVMNRYMNELEDKGVVVDGKLVEYVCLDSKRGSELVISWEVE